jgi:hypothetical protein
MYQTYNWVILKMFHKGETYYKVLAQVDAGRNGWRINSGVTKIEFEDGAYNFHGLTGSVYQCLAEEERLSRTTIEILNKLEATGNVEVVKAKDMLKEHLLKA